MVQKKKVVVIGGGTGTFTVLSGLKKFPQLDLSVIVSMMDSGGSNRVIRDEFGLLPISDLRQCMVALSSEKPSELVRELFTYRFSQGTGIAGMTFGNLFMAALTDIYGSQEKAIEKTCEFLDVQGKIIPVTFENTNLVARYDNGKQVLGEHFIDEPDEDLCKHRIVELSVFPPAGVNIKAKKVIEEADLVVLSPGDLFTSLICNLVIDNMAGMIKKSKSKKVYVMNLMTRWGQTGGFKASDHINEIEKYLGKGTIDCVLINKEKVYPGEILERYKEENAYPVENDIATAKGPTLKVITKDLVSEDIYEKPKADKLHRSLIRHDPDKLAKAIVELLH